MQRAGCAFVRDTTMHAVARPFDVVRATNSGYPVDLNDDEAITGISSTARLSRRWVTCGRRRVLGRYL